MITNNWFMLLFSGCFESRTPLPTKYNFQKRLEKVPNDVTIDVNVCFGFRYPATLQVTWITREYWLILKKFYCETVRTYSSTPRFPSSFVLCVWHDISGVPTGRNSTAQVIRLNVIVDNLSRFILGLTLGVGCPLNPPLIMNKQMETKAYFQKPTENRKIL
jgi:hypothetical protein